MTIKFENCAIGKPQPWPRPVTPQKPVPSREERDIWLPHAVAVVYIAEAAGIPLEAAEEALIEGITERLIRMRRQFTMLVPEDMGHFLRLMAIEARPDVSENDVRAVWPDPAHLVPPKMAAKGDLFVMVDDAGTAKRAETIPEFLELADVAMERLVKAYQEADELERTHLAALARCSVEALGLAEKKRHTGGQGGEGGA